LGNISSSFPVSFCKKQLIAQGYKRETILNSSGFTKSWIKKEFLGLFHQKNGYSFGSDWKDGKNNIQEACAKANHEMLKAERGWKHRRESHFLNLQTN
jgi:hypothetical protein